MQAKLPITFAPNYTLKDVIRLAGSAAAAARDFTVPHRREAVGARVSISMLIALT